MHPFTYELNIEEVPYNKRRGRMAIWSVFAALIFFCICLYRQTGIQEMCFLLVLLAMLFGYTFFLSPWHFITSIKIEGDQISIHYTRKGHPMFISGLRKDFMFTRHTGRNKYLEIRYRDKKVISQDPGGEWTIALMDQVCREARKDRPHRSQFHTLSKKC